ncbi:MAG: ATP-binding protein [Acidobacteria bacterium]|nr:ATP-binding protein [Acidobacteriota bacterium]
MDRPGYVREVEAAFAVHPVVAILGPRQCGKTTLARMFAGHSRGRVTSFDLEDPTGLARLEDPKLALQDLRGLVIIDEIQRKPALFEVLRVLVDRRPNPARLLILGSASRDLIRQSSETLAGRIRYLELTPFQLREAGADHTRRLWLRGGFPRSYLARSEADSMTWRKAFISTFLERDIPNLGLRIPAVSLRRLWMMLAHCHGQTLNTSAIGRSLGIADTTVRRYLDILSGTFMIRQLAPWYENISKRQVRAPKIYFRDSGILHSFLGVDGYAELLAHPKLGASWEGFALEEIIRASGAGEEEIFFWSSHGEAELDLLLVRGGRRSGYEVKYTSRPAVAKSTRIAMRDLKLTHLDVVCPGGDGFPIGEGIRAIGLARLIEDLAGQQR